jgi:hypothetical protein
MAENFENKRVVVTILPADDERRTPCNHHHASAIEYVRKILIYNNIIDSYIIYVDSYYAR